MKEIQFLNNNAERWREFEQLFKKKKAADPDRLADLFVQITDDLAYAQTFYPKSKTTAYLNQLAGRVHREIYKNKRENRSRFITFWKEEVPDAFGSSMREVWTAVGVFFIAVLIGAFSASIDDSFVRLIMGDAYVNMTLANIEKDDPMAVYKQANEIDMFLGITFNNVRVSFLAFVGGIAFSVGTGYLLFSNGIMLGSFQYFFYDKGLLWESARTIWIHGTLEISVIVLAGAAGFVLGNSFLFPKTFSRKESLKRGAKKGLKMIIGLVPIFILAGFLEGFVTRLTDLPDIFNIVIIGLSLSFIIGYFFVYPYYRIRINRID